MKTILIKSPNTERNGVPMGHLLSPNEASTTRTGLYPTELWAKGVPNSSIACQDNNLFTANRQGPLAEHKLTELIEHGEVEMVSTLNFHPSLLLSLVGKGTLQVTKKET